MSVDRGIRQMRVVPVTPRDRAGAPLEERLLAEAQHPAGHRDGDPVAGKVTDQRVDHFGSDDCDRYAAALRRISFSCSSNRIRFYRPLFAHAAAPDPAAGDWKAPNSGLEPEGAAWSDEKDLYGELLLRKFNLWPGSRTDPTATPRTLTIELCRILRIPPGHDQESAKKCIVTVLEVERLLRSRVRAALRFYFGRDLGNAIYKDYTNGPVSFGDMAIRLDEGDHPTTIVERCLELPLA